MKNSEPDFKGITAMMGPWEKWTVSLPQMKDPADPVTLLSMCGCLGHESLTANYWDLMQGSLHSKSMRAPRRRRS